MQAGERASAGANLKDFNGSLLAAFAVLIFAPALAPLAGWLAPDWSTWLLLAASAAAMLLATAWLAWQLGSAAYRTANAGGFVDAPETQLPST